MNLLLQYDPLESAQNNILAQSNTDAEFEMHSMDDILMEAGLTTASQNLNDGNTFFTFDIDHQGSHSMLFTSDSSNSDQIQSLVLPNDPPQPLNIVNSQDQTTKKQPRKRTSANKSKKGNAKNKTSESESSILDVIKNESGLPDGADCGAMVSGKTSQCIVWKRCQVCEDRAVNHNFGQLTCESCKAFFRRNAHKKMKLKCASGDDNCEITSETRKQCPSCRLNKCFLIGMRSDLIQIRKNGNKPRWNGQNPSRPNSCKSNNVNQTQTNTNYNPLPPIMPKLLPGDPHMPNCAYNGGDVMLPSQTTNDDNSHAELSDCKAPFSSTDFVSSGDSLCLVQHPLTCQKIHDLGSVCLNSGIVQQSFYPQQFYFNPHVQQVDSGIPMEQNHQLYSEGTALPQFNLCASNIDSSNYAQSNQYVSSGDSNAAFWLDEWPSTLSSSCSANQDEAASLSSLFNLDQSSGGGQTQMPFSLSNDQSEATTAGSQCQSFDPNGMDLPNSTTTDTNSPISTPGQVSKDTGFYNNNNSAWTNVDDMSSGYLTYSNSNQSVVTSNDLITDSTSSLPTGQLVNGHGLVEQTHFFHPGEMMGPQLHLSASSQDNADNSVAMQWTVNNGATQTSLKQINKTEEDANSASCESSQQQQMKLVIPIRHPTLGTSPRIIQLEWAWAATWSNGSFSNPAGVQLRLDTTADPEWPLICINMADIFLRKLLLMIKRIPEVQKLEPQLQTNLAKVRLLTTIPVLYASCLLNPEEVGAEQIPGVDQVVRFLVTTSREEVLLDLSKLGAAIFKLNPAKYSILQHLGVYCRNLAQLLDRRPALFALYLLIKLFDTSPTKLEETVSAPNSASSTTATNFLFQSSSSSSSPSISPSLSSPGNLSSFNATNSPPVNCKPPSMTSPLPATLNSRHCHKPPNFSSIQAEYVDLFCECVRHYSLSDESNRLKTLKELLMWSVQFDKCFQAFFRDTATNFPLLTTQIVSEFSTNSA